MARLLAIDYGKKRCGIAVTDTEQIIANGLATVATHQLLTFLKDYVSREEVECFILGWPTQLNGQASDNQLPVKQFAARLTKAFPQIPTCFTDERFTSVLAHQAILQSGISKKRRREDKGLVDEISACIILQSYIESRHRL